MFSLTEASEGRLIGLLCEAKGGWALETEQACFVVVIEAGFDFAANQLLEFGAQVDVHEGSIAQMSKIVNYGHWGRWALERSVSRECGPRKERQ